MKTLVLSFTLLSGMLSAQQSTPQDVNASLRNEIRESIRKGLQYLDTQQQADGRWSEPENPAITALVLSAYMNNPERKATDPLPDHIKKGYEFLLSTRQPDGGFYVKGNASYNTSLASMALLARGDEKDRDILKAAQKFLIAQQQDYDAKGQTDNPMDGGIGYGGSYEHSDMSNTHFALEALHYLKIYFSDTGDKPEKDLDWNAAITFVERCQNNPKNGQESTKNVDEKNQGGFFYFPGNSKAGEIDFGDGKKALRSYGSITYAGMLSFIYAGVDKNDERVKMIFDWLKHNYTLDENPGMGAEGLFYYYHTMAKGLSLAGTNELEMADGTKVPWREALLRKLVNLQKENGSWINDGAGRWKENDSSLVSAYTILALEHIYRSL